MELICQSDKCFGCGLCSIICPVKAITMTDGAGFYRPVINVKKCINCKRCVNHCIANSDNRRGQIALSTYAAWSIDDDTHYNCASGGIATEISRAFITAFEGTVVGCGYDLNMIVYHKMIRQYNEIDAIKKSKYVYSDLTKCYDDILSEWKQNKKVLFIGVPCQVYAVKKYAEINKINISEYLYTIDLLCHGGASPKIFQEHVNRISKGKQIDNVTFRGGEYDCQFTAYVDGNIVYQRGQFEDEYYYCFMKRVIYSPCCYECPFANDKRVGDITLGDFWGLSENFKEVDANKGINMVMVNTENGKKLVEAISNRSQLFLRQHNEAVAGNDTLREPTLKPLEYKEFWEKYNKIGFHETIKIIYNNQPNKAYRKIMLKKKIKNMIPKILLKKYRVQKKDK